MAAQVATGNVSQDLPTPGSNSDAQGTAFTYGLGCAVLVLSNLSSSFAFLLWRASGIHEAGLPFLQRWRWWLGFVLLVPVLLAEAVVAYALLPQSVLACFSALSIVFTALISHLSSVHSIRKCLCNWCLTCLDVQEHLSLFDWCAVVAVTFGVTLISVFDGLTNGDTLTMSDAASVLTDPGTLTFAAVAWVMGLGCAVMIGLGIVERCESYASNGSSVNSMIYLVIVLAFAAAMCAAVSVASMRILSVAVYTIARNGWDTITSWPVSAVWYALLALAIDVPIQYYLLHKTLTHAPVTIGVPAYSSFVVLTGVVANYIIWGTPGDSINSLSVAINLIALALVIAGLAVLCSSQQQRQQGQREATERMAESFTINKESIGGERLVKGSDSNTNPKLNPNFKEGSPLLG